MTGGYRPWSKFNAHSWSLLNARRHLLGKVAEINREWWRSSYDENVGLIDPVPGRLLNELSNLYYKHQLFLDSDSVMALDLLVEVYHGSLPFDDGSGSGPIRRDVQGPYDNAEYLQPRIALLFQQKIGVVNNRRAVRQIALLGAVRILNRYHFSPIDLPIKGNLKLDSSDGAAEAVMKAERSFDELLPALRKFYHYLHIETAFFHKAETSLERYLAVLDHEHPTNAV